MASEKRKVILRADGNSDIGLGHVMRCCALAEMLNESFDCDFYIREPSKAIIENISRHCESVIEMNGNISYKDEVRKWCDKLSGEEIIVLDGYHYDTDYQEEIKKKGCKLVCIDDIHAYHFMADAIINHAPGIEKKQYSYEAYTKLYLGTNFLLLQQIFLEKALLQKRVLDFESSPILICFGGSDPKNTTFKVVKQVNELFPEKKLIVVIGSAYKHKNALIQFCENHNKVVLYQNVASNELATLMQRTHIAISSASTVAFEYLCIKGNLFLIQTADNQEQIYKGLIEKKCAYPYEALHDQYNALDIINNQYSLIDGKSNIRLLNLFKEL